MAVGPHKKGDEVCPNPPHGCVVCCPTKQRILPDYIFVSELEMYAAIFQALGYASVCWESMANTGKFQEFEARRVGEELMEIVRKFSTQYPKRRPGLHEIVIMVSDGIDWAACGLDRNTIHKEGDSIVADLVSRLDDHLEESAAKRRVSG